MRTPAFDRLVLSLIPECKDSAMAVAVETLVPRASKSEFDQIEVAISRAIEQTGRPPAGLMSHFVRPSGDGFLLCEIWRSTEDMQPFYDEVLLPTLAAAGCEAQEPIISPVWSFARP
ncbi:MAG TPA: hypothetical protein DCQ04_11580 [Actinobacteria bacterium]|nr:hypothetical protein [Actinomycetota bacterium]